LVLIVYAVYRFLEALPNRANDTSFLDKQNARF
jgi:hypothetical protein